MFKVEFDIKMLARNMSDIERRQLPFALANALNDTAFETRQAWKELMPRVFDRPTPFTLNAVLYKKATKQNALTAEIFIRDEASGGTPPVKYLAPEEYGGARRQKAFEKSIERFVPAARRFYVPGRGARLDPYGNIPGSLIRKIQSQIGGAESVLGFMANETMRSRARRLRRQRRRGGGGSFFVLSANRGKLQAGVVYERIVTGFGSAVRSVLFPVDQAPRYRPRFGAIDAAHRIARSKFPANFARRMQQAIRT